MASQLMLKCKLAERISVGLLFDLRNRGQADKVINRLHIKTRVNDLSSFRSGLECFPEWFSDMNTLSTMLLKNLREQ